MRRVLARALLSATGFEAEGAPPALPKYVLIAAPHTSNWDLAYVLAFAALYGVDISFMMKHTLFRGPLGPVFRRLGGIPIRRERSGNRVSEMARLFASREAFVLVVPAEGTRSRVDVWKSGFYHIAREAGVPIVLSYLDYGRRRGGFGPAIVPSGNVRADMDLVRAFYADKTGRHPERFGGIALREEEIAGAA